LRYKNKFMCRNKSTHSSEVENDILYRRLAVKQQQLSELLLEQMQTNVVPAGRHAATASQTLKALIRIVGGVPALPDEFNECCLIGTRSPDGSFRWFCTGVLIDQRIVLTAAHCIQSRKSYVVALSTNSQDQLAGEAEIIATRKAAVHPEYGRNNDFNDIAVLVLQTPAATAPVPLATTEEIAACEEVELVGFGNDDILSTKGFGLKRKVVVDTVSLRRNAGEDLSVPESKYGFESDLEFVAGGQGYDSCNGDSGGPAYIITARGRAVAGLTSRMVQDAPHKCGDGGIYTRVDAHRSFIQSF
jgi:endonuclease G